MNPGNLTVKRPTNKSDLRGGFPRRRQRRVSAALAVLLSARGANAVSVSVGHSHACVVLNDGKLMCWGNNDDGQLGIGSTGGFSTIPVEVDLGSGHTAKAVECGWSSTCAILDDDTLKCWGEKVGGKHGYGDETDRNAPEATTVVNLGSGRTAKAVSIGYENTCVILDDDSLKCWGRGITSGYGNLNYYLLSPHTTAVDLGSGRTAKAVSAGVYHNCAILDDNTVKCWGLNNAYELGWDPYPEIFSYFCQSWYWAHRDERGYQELGDHDGRNTCATLDNGELICWGSPYWDSSANHYAAAAAPAIDLNSGAHSSDGH